MTNPTFTARTPVDLIAMAPLVLGFHPEDSIVMLTFGGRPDRQFHARVGLPAPDDLEQVVDVLTKPVVKHGIGAAALLIYTEDEVLAWHVAAVLGTTLLDVGCELVDVLQVGEDTYRQLDEPGAVPVPYDISHHPFAAEAVLLGRRTFANRAEVADQLVGGSEEEIDAVRAAALHVEDPELGRALIGLLIRQWLDDRRLPEVSEMGALATLLADREMQDVVLSETDSLSATELIDFWIHVVRRCPSEFLPGPTSLLAFSAWLAGDGALAWCAIDRCLGEDPDHHLGNVVARLLEQAVPPQTWAGEDTSRSA